MSEYEGGGRRSFIVYVCTHSLGGSGGHAALCIFNSLRLVVVQYHVFWSTDRFSDFLKHLVNVYQNDYMIITLLA